MFYSYCWVKCILTWLYLFIRGVSKMLVETVAKFKALYAEKRDVVDWMEKFGNDFEKAEAKIVKKIALDF